ncbi:MAG: DUF447 family protein [Planctomycetota bacterium]|nr:DUF447 family protein [Planctomycetota bacterium]MDA1179006.1 DUF447 family protein [Planctomycetota bacterium]
MILEGLVTTINDDGSVNLSPMGPALKEGSFSEFSLRPFDTSTTYRNLAREGEGVFHVTDDVEMIAYAAVGQLKLPPMMPAPGVRGWIVRDACRWYAFRVRSALTSGPRIDMTCDVVAHGALREFWGLNRAKHAVLEAAILATRIHLLERSAIESELARLEPLVIKTGGTVERRTFEFLQKYVASSMSQPAE